MGKMKIKRSRKDKINLIVNNDARDMAKECEEIFEDEYETAIVKMIKLDEKMDRATRMYVSLNMQDLYEILLDNSIPDILAYYKEKMDAEIHTKKEKA